MPLRTSDNRLARRITCRVWEIITGSLCTHREEPLQMGIICSSCLGNAFVRAVRIQIPLVRGIGLVCTCANQMDLNNVTIAKRGFWPRPTSTKTDKFIFTGRKPEMATHRIKFWRPFADAASLTVSLIPYTGLTTSSQIFEWF